MTGPFCQHKHWGNMGICRDCDAEVNEALGEFKETGTIRPEFWKNLNVWQRGEISERIGSRRIQPKEPTP